MKTNTYLLLLLTIFFISLFGSCKHSKKEAVHENAPSYLINDQSCIEHIISVDDSIGKIRNYNCEKISLSATIRIYTSGLEELDFSACPEDFTVAFNAHIQAWKDMTTLTDKYLRLRGEMHDLFDEIEAGEDAEEFKPLLDNIWSTWAEIEKAMPDKK